MRPPANARDDIVQPRARRCVGASAGTSDDPHLFDAFCLLLLCGLRVYYSSRLVDVVVEISDDHPREGPVGGGPDPHSAERDRASSIVLAPARWRLSRCTRGSPPRAPTRARLASRRHVFRVIPAAPGRVALHPPRDRRTHPRARRPRRRSAIVPVGRPRDALVVPASRAVVNAAADDAPDAPVSPFPELEATKASDAERSAALCKDTTRAALAFAFVFATTAAILAAHFGAVPLADLPCPETWAVMHSTSEGFRGLLPTVGGVLRGLDYFGTALFAQAGVVQAGRRGMDLLGCLIVGCITAMGGGTFADSRSARDPFWAAEPDYLYISLAASLLTFYLWPAVERRVRNKRALETWLNWGDARSASARSASSARTTVCAARTETSLVAVAASMFTASFGGIIRDVFCGMPARILHSHREMYSSITSMGAATYVTLAALQVPLAVRVYVPIALVVALRYFAWSRGWRLPTYRE